MSLLRGSLALAARENKIKIPGSPQGYVFVELKWALADLSSSTIFSSRHSITTEKSISWKRTHLITMADFDVSQSPAGVSDDGLALRKEFLEQARARDVIGVHVGVHAVLQLQAEVTDRLGVAVRRLDDL